MLDSLAPSLATGAFEWVTGDKAKPIRQSKLPESLRESTHGCWIELTHEARRRWVLLSHHPDKEEASKSLLDWAQKLHLTDEDVFSTHTPPVAVYYFRAPKRW